jgi:hypothetical protein
MGIEQLQIRSYDQKGLREGVETASISFDDPTPGSYYSFCVGFRYLGGGSMRDPANWRYDHTNMFDEVKWRRQRTKYESVPVPLELVTSVLAKGNITMQELLETFCGLLIQDYPDPPDGEVFWL